MLFLTGFELAWVTGEFPFIFAPTGPGVPGKPNQIPYFQKIKIEKKIRKNLSKIFNVRSSITHKRKKKI